MQQQLRKEFLDKIMDSTISRLRNDEEIKKLKDELLQSHYKTNLAHDQYEQLLTDLEPPPFDLGSL